MAEGTVVLTNLRPAPSAEAQPRVSMHDWRVIEFDGEQSLVGFLQNGLTCRLTTEITSIDFPARELRTRSGRLYELLGPPACQPEQLAVIAAHVTASIGSPWTDVTNDTWAAMCRTTA